MGFNKIQVVSHYECGKVNMAMKKILLFGEYPLPIDNSNIMNGPCLRTWQFAKPLLDKGYKVCLISTPAFNMGIGKGTIEKKVSKNFIRYSIKNVHKGIVGSIQIIHDKFKPDCIVSVSSFYALYFAVNLKTDRPIWFDQGDLMAEAQIKSEIDKDDRCLIDFLNLEKFILKRGDVFSTVSTPQKFALVGKLGENGRLNRHSVGYEFVYVIPCGIENKKFVHKKAIIRDKYVRKSDFVVLWAGGYNNWLDVETLYSGIERAMAKNEKVKFVSTAGPGDSKEEGLYKRFLDLIGGSKFRDRFVMLGCIPTKDLHSLYMEADLGLNMDRYCYEVVLGSRNRVLEWMMAGLPVLSTTPSELTQMLGEKKLIFTIPQSNAKALSDAIVQLSGQQKKLKTYSREARKFLCKHFLSEKTIEPLLKWLENPCHSPDIAIKYRKNYASFDNKFEQSVEQEYIEDLRIRIDDLKAKSIEKDKIYSELKAKESELTNFKHHASNLEGERDGLKKHTKNLETERDNLRVQAEKFNTSAANLEKQLKDITNDRDTLKLKIKDSELELTNLKHHASNLEGERDGLKKHTKNLETERDNLAIQIKKLNIDSDASEKRLFNITNELKTKETELIGARNRAVKLEEEKEKSKERLENLEAKLEDLRNENAGLSVQLEKIYATNWYKISKKCNKLVFWRKDVKD